MVKRAPKNGIVFRVHKTKRYTLMNNTHLNDKKLSLKAKGLLSIMFSKSEDWNFSINGLASLSSDGRDSVLSAIKTLQEAGYLVLDKTRDETGHFNTIYNIYETPEDKKKIADTENPTRENEKFQKTSNSNDISEQNLTESENPNRGNRIGKADTEKPTDTNILKLNTEIKRKNIKKEKNSFGEFQNVFLTDEHIEKLKKIYKTDEDFEKAIGILSSYKESKKKTYKNDYAVLNEFNWVYEKIYPKNEQKTVFFKKPKTTAVQGKSSLPVSTFTDGTPDYERASKW